MSTWKTRCPKGDGPGLEFGPGRVYDVMKSARQTAIYQRVRCRQPF